MIFPVYQDTLNLSRPADSIRIARPLPKSDSIIFSLQRRTEKRSLTRQQKTSAEKVELIQETAQPPKDSGMGWNSSANFFVENALKGIVHSDSVNLGNTTTYETSQKPQDINLRDRTSHSYDWLLGIFLFLVVLFVWIRIFYSKFFSTLANALISFQLSVKLFEERNVLQQRVSMVLDFVYVIVTTIFVFELIEYTRFSGTGMTGINLFLLLLNILMLYSILRVVVLRMTGTLFLVKPLFSEYIHNTYVVNKGVGILLFPVVIMGHYMPYDLIPVILVIGIIVFSVALLYKTFRAYQIIIRRDILIFYLILYLCTLEILPLLLGYKFVTSLIQSN